MKYNVRSASERRELFWVFDEHLHSLPTPFSTQCIVIGPAEAMEILKRSHLWFFSFSGVKSVLGCLSMFKRMVEVASEMFVSGKRRWNMLPCSIRRPSWNSRRYQTSVSERRSPEIWPLLPCASWYLRPVRLSSAQRSVHYCVLCVRWRCLTPGDTVRWRQ